MLFWLERILGWLVETKHSPINRNRVWSWNGKCSAAPLPGSLFKLIGGEDVWNRRIPPSLASQSGGTGTRMWEYGSVLEWVCAASSDPMSSSGGSHVAWANVSLCEIEKRWLWQRKKKNLKDIPYCLNHLGSWICRARVQKARNTWNY